MSKQKESGRKGLAPELDGPMPQHRRMALGETVDGQTLPSTDTVHPKGAPLGTQAPRKNY